MSIIAQTRSFVIGVDTHARNHVLAILAATTGALVATAEFPTTPQAITRAIAWAARRTDADLDTLWAIEGVGCYGATLARAVTDAGYQVIEAPRYAPGRDRTRGKSDPLDAQRIARAALPLDHTQLRQPRADTGERAALRTVLAARQDMTKERTGHINALTALLRAIDLGVDARRALSAKQITQVSRWRHRPGPIAETTARTEATRLAKRITVLDQDLAANQKTMRTLILATPAAALLDQTGIGPVTAAVALTAWSHLGRIRSEAAYAALAGVNPIPASSGNTVRHRLNRGGDRRLNQALHMATITRMTHHEPTRQYVQRRTAEGKTLKEIRRCLKRYLARQIYRHLNNTATTTTT